MLGLGDAWSDINNAIGIAADAAPIAFEIVRDPALPGVARLIGELHALEQPTGPSGIPIPGAPIVPGIGLRRLVLPLKGYVAYRRNPIVVGALVLGLVFGIPFMLGRMSK